MFKTKKSLIILLSAILIIEAILGWQVFNLRLKYAELQVLISNNQAARKNSPVAKAEGAVNSAGANPVAQKIVIERNSIEGRLEKIEGNLIYLITNPLYPTADRELNNRVVEIDNNTKYYQQSAKDQQEYKKEMDEFLKISQSKAADNQKGGQSAMPEYYQKVEIGISDLKTNSQVSISADKNIVELKRFLATEILILPPPAK